MDFNYSSEDEAFPKEFRGWLAANSKDVMPSRELLAEEGASWRDAVAWHQKLNE